MNLKPLCIVLIAWFIVACHSKNDLCETWSCKTFVLEHPLIKQQKSYISQDISFEDILQALQKDQQINTFIYQYKTQKRDDLHFDQTVTLIFYDGSTLHFDYMGKKLYQIIYNAQHCKLNPLDLKILKNITFILAKKPTAPQITLPNPYANFHGIVEKPLDPKQDFERQMNQAISDLNQEMPTTFDINAEFQTENTYLYQLRLSLFKPLVKKQLISAIFYTF